MSNFTQYVTIENVLILVMAIVIALGIYDKYKKAKANDGKVDTSELFNILLSANADIASLLSMAEDSTTVKTVDDKRKFVADHLGEVINKTDLLTDEQKQLLQGFGMDNIAKIIVRKTDTPKQIDKKEETNTVTKETENKEVTK